LLDGHLRHHAAIQWLQRHFDQPLRMGEIAREFGMSVSGFHHHFRALTAMSPFSQKRGLFFWSISVTIVVRYSCPNADSNFTRCSFPIALAHPADPGFVQPGISGGSVSAIPGTLLFCRRLTFTSFGRSQDAVVNETATPALCRHSLPQLG